MQDRRFSISTFVTLLVILQSARFRRFCHHQVRLVFPLQTCAAPSDDQGQLREDPATGQSDNRIIRKSAGRAATGAKRPVSALLQ
jgi:hypothetical protein